MHVRVDRRLCEKASKRRYRVQRIRIPHSILGGIQDSLGMEFTEGGTCFGDKGEKHQEISIRTGGSGILTAEKANEKGEDHKDCR